MAFKNRLFNRVESDRGFFVKIRSFEGFVEYREGQKTAVVPVEPVIGRPLVNIYTNVEIRWNPPHADELISAEKKTEILQNIAEAMRFRKYNVDIV